MLLRILCVLALLSSKLAWSVGLPPPKRVIEIPEIFPRSVLIDNKVWFWELIFGHYTSQHLVIHDVVFPHVIIDVIDLDEIRERQVELAALDDREVLRVYLERYRQALTQFKKRGAQAAVLSAMEKRIWEAYEVEPETLEHLLKGRAEIRSQRGLRDRFDEAVVRAQRYLPHMEQVFREHQLPIELTRLPFVESMFNFQARSKVGASGVWQFMPGTARQYMIVNQLIDERNSPWKATRGAARLLAHNFGELKSWPLAITAYNHGLNGMRRAVRQVDSTDMEAIIRRYQSPSFGFASRNFYTEFLAAYKVYQERYSPEKVNVEPINVASLRIPKELTMSQLVANTPLTQTMLRELNPCLSGSFFHGQRQLPKHFEIVVPKNLAARVEKAMERF